MTTGAGVWMEKPLVTTGAQRALNREIKERDFRLKLYKFTAFRTALSRQVARRAELLAAKRVAAAERKAIVRDRRKGAA